MKKMLKKTILFGAGLIGGLLIIGAAYISLFTYISYAGNRAFDAVQMGDDQETVVALFHKKPSVRETSSALFPRYAAENCKTPCTVRLWYENRLTLDTEAWSVELDKNGKVVRKSKWISP